MSKVAKACGRQRRSTRSRWASAILSRSRKWGSAILSRHFAGCHGVIPAPPGRGSERSPHLEVRDPRFLERLAMWCVAEPGIEGFCRALRMQADLAVAARLGHRFECAQHGRT